MSTEYRIGAAKDILIILVAGLIFLVHSALFSDWIVDDAAISFAYARNLAEGHGLVPQPGLSPVEGYSNFAWIMLFVPFFKLNLFHPLIVPKVLSFILVMCAYILVFRACREASDGNLWVPALVLVLLGVNTPFVVWTASGMENPLYVCLLSFYLLLTLRACRGDHHSQAGSLIAGVIGGLIALTRPEGVLYAVAYPLCQLLSVQGSVMTRLRACSKRFLVYGLAVGVLIAGYVWFRWAYFHAILPMPYYAKKSDLLTKLPLILSLHSAVYARVYDLAVGFGGFLGMWVFVVAVGATAFLIAKGRFKNQFVPFGILAAISILAFVLLIPDWMREYRFATFFFVVWYSYVALLIHAVIEYAKWTDRTKRSAAIAVFAVTVGLSVVLFSGRTAAFHGSPTLPMWQVERILGHKLNEYARLFGVRNGSVMTPDAGGTLYSSKLRVYDMGGLLDPIFAGRVPLWEVHDYIFQQIKPTFVFTHGVWTWGFRLKSDPRFEHDYMPLVEFEYRTEPTEKGTLSPVGLYIRKDAIGNDPGVVNLIRRDLLQAFDNTRWDF